jgi:protein dithiol oxidoreductase (disulfide-forming)
MLDRFYVARARAARRMLGFAAALAAFMLLCSGNAAGQLVEGRNYQRLRQAHPVETGRKIEVIEFFSYACPHCAELEPHLQTWLAKQPADVQFRRVPVMFYDRWVPMAKVYYTLDTLGSEAKLSPDVFKAIHGSNTPLWNEKTFFDWAAAKGLDRKGVEDVYGSFAIAGKMNRAKQLAQVYDVQSVPMIVVDGKFVTSSDKVGTHAQLPAALDELVAKARAERPKG